MIRLMFMVVLSIVFTASNCMMIFWGESFQWLIIVVLSSVSLGFLVDDIYGQVKILFSSWFLSIILTTYIICYPFIVFGESVAKLNELLFNTVGRLVFVVLIGLVLSSIVSIVSSLLVERVGDVELHRLG